MEKLYGIERLQAEFPLVFEVAAQIRHDLEEIDRATATDIERLRAHDAPIEDIKERSRIGYLSGVALRKELEAISRNLTDILATYQPAPIVIPDAQAQTRR